MLFNLISSKLLLYVFPPTPPHRDLEQKGGTISGEGEVLMRHTCELMVWGRGTNQPKKEAGSSGTSGCSWSPGRVERALVPGKLVFVCRTSCRNRVEEELSVHVVFILGLGQLAEFRASSLFPN